MKNVRKLREINFNKILDEFLQKAINVILKSRINNSAVKDKQKNTNFFSIEDVYFDLAEHFNDEYEELKPVETTKFYILDIFYYKKKIKFLVEKFTFQVDYNLNQMKYDEIVYDGLIKKLATFVRSVYSISTILPNYKLKFENNNGSTFDYKFYCKKKLNNKFVEKNHKQTNFSLDVNVAKIYLSIKYYMKSDIFLIEDKIIYKRIEEKLIDNPISLNKRCRILSEGCKIIIPNKPQQFEVKYYENTLINEDYFHRKYSTQFYDSTSNNKLLNQTHFREEFVKNPNSYFENKILETLDIGKLNYNNKNDSLSIFSSLSSKEEEIASLSKAKDDITKNKKDLIFFEHELSKKIVESNSSSVSSLDSFELEFEDNELKYNLIKEENENLINSENSNDKFKLEDFIQSLKNLKKQIKNKFMKIKYITMLKVN